MKTIAAKKENDAGDALPLLALKVAPFQFDVNYKFSNISIRDQIVRAQMAVRALVSTGLLHGKTQEPNPPSPMKQRQLLICGAGVAGIAAAWEAENLGLSFVLIDAAARFPAGVLASKAERYVSPAMYEWPSITFDEHTFPLSQPSLLGSKLSPDTLTIPMSEPLPIAEFSRRFQLAVHHRVDSWLANAKSLPQQRVFFLQTRISRNSKLDLLQTLTAGTTMLASATVKGPHAVPGTVAALKPVTLEKSGDALEPISFDYVLYAAGFGKESRAFDDGRIVRTLQLKGFWERDKLTRKYFGISTRDRSRMRPSALVVGSGDGALQDALRCLTRSSVTPQPVAIWHALIGTLRLPGHSFKDIGGNASVKALLNKLATFDTYTTSGYTWSAKHNVFSQLDDNFKAAAIQFWEENRTALVANASRFLRNDVERIVIATRSLYFGRAYALNRFLVYLLNVMLSDARARKRWWPKLELTDDLSRVQGRKRKSRGGLAKFKGSKSWKDFEVIILRGGLERGFGQHVGLSIMNKGRIELGRIPPPIVAV